ncbi:MAG: acyl carrier protein [Proteobacteria bacterium]|nr:acyl carrier protein [Pseudomonadota bacterium]
MALEVADIVRDVLDAPDLAIGPDTTADDVPGWDSFAHINIVVATEARFGIRFGTAEVETLHNIGDLVALVARKTKVAA